MRKFLICLVAAVLYSGISGAEYLNPIYPVYAETSVSNVTPLKPVPAAAKRLEEEKMRVASKEAELRSRGEVRKENIASRVANLKDKMASREAALKKKLGQFKDKIKAASVERINQTLGLINSRRIEMMKLHLGQITKILDIIETRVNEAAANGKNVDLAKSAISSARTAISDATKAVAAQGEKDYTIEVSSETTVKSDAKESRDTLFSDLKSTHELVRKAREAVQNALKAAKEAIGVNSSPSANP